MAEMMFGTDETLTCIQHVKVTGHDGEPLCLAYKTTKTFFIAGVRLRDDGYVLGVETGGTVTKFYKLPDAEMTRLQDRGLIPRPLPSYSIPWYEYAFGYSLWIVIVFTAFFMVFARWLKQRRAARYAAELKNTPVSHGPPVVTTEADRFIQDELRSHLEAGEAIQHQAYVLDHVMTGTIGSAVSTRAFFAALSDRRLFLIKTRLGAFKILLENRGVESIDRDRIKAVRVDDYAIVLHLDDGSVRVMVVQPNKKLSNQAAFLRDVPRLLAPARPQAA
jgi:hypothetical protein